MGLDLNSIEQVVESGLCTGCGACVAFSPDEKAKMVPSTRGPVPYREKLFPSEALEVCPGKGIDYPDLHESVYKKWDSSELAGPFLKARVGFSSDPEIRRKSSSGGVITTVLKYLLETGKVDGALVATQLEGKPLEASGTIVYSASELSDKAQSIYIPVSILDHLNSFKEGKSYAAICLPDQAAALRKMQALSHPKALQVKVVLGPYTGTAMEPECLNSFLRSHGKKASDVTSLRWRDGEWPGYLSIGLRSGEKLKIPKVYYNYLIPFFITRNSLLNMDFANEFTDLSVGDAWSPKYEAKGEGFSIFVSRTREMESILESMIDLGLLSVEEEDLESAIEMHNHMLEFKKRGGYIRGRLRRFWGKPSPDYGMKPNEIGFPRLVIELIITTIFFLSSFRISRRVLELVPQSLLGPFFNRIRLSWKSVSKSVKRKGLREIRMIKT